MENSAIEWTDHTHNFWVGCTKVSPACDGCYAESWAKRAGHPELWQGERRRTADANWRKPLKWNAAADSSGERLKVFTNSLADFFDNQADPQWRIDAWALIKATPHLDWLILTKRPQNIAKMLPPDWGDGYSNVWLGTTVENQEEANRRIHHLRAIPAYVRFLSMEPLLGQTVPDLSGIHWVITGGESGGNARPSHPDWFRSIRDQCASAGVAYLHKQNGEFVSILCRETQDPDWRADYSRQFAHADRRRWLNLQGGMGFHGERFQVMERIGKKFAGRQLDGVTHDGYPA